MKNFIKFGLVGLAGYFVGFYEYKYKVMKLMLDSKLKKEEEDSKDEEK